MSIAPMLWKCSIHTERGPKFACGGAQSFSAGLTLWLDYRTYRRRVIMVTGDAMRVVEDDAYPDSVLLTTYYEVRVLPPRHLIRTYCVVCDKEDIDGSFIRAFAPVGRLIPTTTMMLQLKKEGADLAWSAIR